jgi:predicted CopG family antitoxin
LSKVTKVINITPTVKEKLDKLKLFQRETYNEIIERLIKKQKEV